MMVRCKTRKFLALAKLESIWSIPKFFLALLSGRVADKKCSNLVSLLQMSNRDRLLLESKVFQIKTKNTL